jgi:hypothetical protein
MRTLFPPYFQQLEKYLSRATVALASNIAIQEAEIEARPGKWLPRPYLEKNYYKKNKTKTLTGGEFLHNLH